MNEERSIQQHPTVTIDEMISNSKKRKGVAPENKEKGKGGVSAETKGKKERRIELFLKIGVEEAIVAKMQRRMPTSGSGRPSGTDGSDFSYRMVVDSRYQKVARAKSILRSFFLVQAITLLIGLFLLIFHSAADDLAFHGLQIAATACGLISLIIGELGRKHSRVNALRFFLATSSIVVSFLIYCAIWNYLRFRTAKSPSYWETALERPEVAIALVGLVFHVFIIGYTIHLIANMSPS
ncbi:hypothetical protein DITRI_Ditri03aG0002100 [Diplodiscus trichospermus]